MSDFDIRGQKAARKPLTDETEYIDRGMTYAEWHKKYIEDGPAETERRKMQEDREQHEQYRALLGDEVPESLASFQNIKYNEPERFKLLSDYIKSRGNNMISALTSFQDYETYKHRIQTELVGMSTVDGVRISGQSKHFIERVFGTTRDPATGRPRSGVEIEDIIEALRNPDRIVNKGSSVRYQTKKCSVSVNPDTKILIQTNPL